MMRSISLSPASQGASATDHVRVPAVASTVTDEADSTSPNDPSNSMRR